MQGLELSEVIEHWLKLADKLGNPLSTMPYEYLNYSVQPFFLLEHLNKIIDTYQYRKEEQKSSRRVSLKEIADMVEFQKELVKIENEINLEKTNILNFKGTCS